MRKTVSGQIYTEDFCFKTGEVTIENGLIVDVKIFDNCDKTEKYADNNLRGNHQNAGGVPYVIPGLIDIHMHGAKNIDICQTDIAGLHNISKYEYENGITSFCPTTMTLSVENLEMICSVISQAKNESIIGINLEGPFISKDKCGVQNKDFVLCADADMMGDILQRLADNAGGLIKLVTIAPENPGVLEVIKKYKDQYHFSVGHTNADYDTCKAAFEAGADHVTHLYNALSYVNHREPKSLGAVFDSENAFVEIICDGEHVHPSLVRSAFKIFGDERIVFISDSTQAAGCEDGEYLLGDVPIIKNKTRAVSTENSSVLAGSVSNLFDCMKKAVMEMHIPLEKALRAATYNPAASIGVADTIGSISVGKKAHLVVMDEKMNILEVFR